MSSTEEFQQQRYWEEQYQKKKQDFISQCLEDREIPLGDGIIAQIERGPVKEYNSNNLTKEVIDEFMDELDRKDGK